VCAACNDESADVLEFLTNAPPNMAKSAKGMWALFRQYSREGRRGLTASMYHEASKSDQIWQFIKGRLRIYCFEDKGGLVVLTHGSVKKGQKADPTEVAAAVRVRNSYVAAREAGHVSMEDWTDKAKSAEEGAHGKSS
jgi:hypothetical protein